MHVVGGIGPGRVGRVAAGGCALEQRLAHLRASGVVNTDEQNVGHWSRPRIMASMRGVVWGRISAVVPLLAVASVAAGGASSLPAKRSTIRFTVLEAKASATFTFYREDGNLGDSDTGRVALQIKRSGRGKGKLTSTGGGVRMPIKQRVAEHVRVKRHSDSGEQITTCMQKVMVPAKGGLKFERHGSRVTVRWAFPQAELRFCPGPKLALRLTKEMTGKYPVNHFRQSPTTLTLTGSSGIDRLHLQGAYR